MNTARMRPTAVSDRMQRCPPTAATEPQPCPTFQFPPRKCPLGEGHPGPPPGIISLTHADPPQRDALGLSLPSSTCLPGRVTCHPLPHLTLVSNCPRQVLLGGPV